MSEQKFIAYDVATIDKILTNLDRVSITGVSSATKLIEAHSLLMTTGKIVAPNKEEGNGDSSSDS